MSFINRAVVQNKVICFGQHMFVAIPARVVRHIERTRGPLFVVLGAGRLCQIDKGTTLLHFSLARVTSLGSSWLTFSYLSFLAK